MLKINQEMEYLLLMFITTTFVNCEWVEISQSPVVIEKGTQKLDFTTLILTTTSTTTQTPSFVKPTINNRKGYIKRVSIQNNKIDTTSSKVKNTSSDTSQQNFNNNKTKINEIKDDYFENVAYLKNNTNAEEIDDDVFYDDDADEAVVEEKENIDEGYSYTNFIPYMSVIQSTLMKNAHNNKKSKVGILQNLRDHLLSEIQNRMHGLWKPTFPNRQGREYKEDSHVEFPSNEGALMTIGFLTFAVFLIKLVLQLIQTIGNNNDNGTTTTTIIGRKRRSADLNKDAIKILNYIDQYRFKNLDF